MGGEASVSKLAGNERGLVRERLSEHLTSLLLAACWCNPPPPFKFVFGPNAALERKEQVDRKFKVICGPHGETKTVSYSVWRNRGLELEIQLSRKAFA